MKILILEFIIIEFELSRKISILISMHSFNINLSLVKLRDIFSNYFLTINFKKR